MPLETPGSDKKYAVNFDQVLASNCGVISSDGWF